MKKKTIEEFIKEANKIHCNKYDYSKTNYINNITKIKIICKKHGIFKQIPSNHLKGIGCPKCGKERFKLNKTSTTKKFISKSRILHHNKYDYSEVNYINNITKVKIICKKHGCFLQRPSDHLQGHGCPKCSKTKLENEYFNKLNNNNIKRNVILIINNKKIFPDGYEPKTKTIYEFYGDYWHGNPKIFKSNDVNSNNKKTFGELYKETIDREKLLIENGFNIISVWESDFKNGK